MEDLFSIEVINSAPLSECDDSDEIVVFEKKPPSVSNLKFIKEEAVFSPVGVSVLSSPNFIEMVIESQRLKHFPQQKRSTPQSKHSEKPKPKCKQCQQSLSDFPILSYKFNRKLYLDSEKCLENQRNGEKEIFSAPVKTENQEPEIFGNLSLSKKYSDAIMILGILDMMSDEEIDEGQRLLIQKQSTLVVKVLSCVGQNAWEVPSEFTVQDLIDLVFSVTNHYGKAFCNGSELDIRLMIGFVRLYIWRKADILTIEIVNV